ncbi:hypothetical protein ACP4OV_029497 [Aristida adscensionis]
MKFLTYNVWSCEHVAVYRRMSIREIIEQHDPDVIFLQEVTDYILSLFQEAAWWRQYCMFSSQEKKQSLLLSKNAFRTDADEPGHLSNCCQPGCRRRSTRYLRLHGRALPRARGDLPSRGPTPSDIGSVRRRTCAGEFLEHFDAVHEPQHGRPFVLDDNVVLSGDIGWDDDLDGPLRLGGDGGWVDAWRELRGGGGEGGWTYDAVANPMLRGFSRPERRRPDRFCRPRDFTLESGAELGMMPWRMEIHVSTLIYMVRERGWHLSDEERRPRHASMFGNSQHLNPSSATTLLDSIEMVGVEPIPGVTRFNDKGDILPVFPSNHFGLLLTIFPKQ